MTLSRKELEELTSQYMKKAYENLLKQMNTQLYTPKMWDKLGFRVIEEEVKPEPTLEEQMNCLVGEPGDVVRSLRILEEENS